MLIDSHCHLTDEKFAEDRADVIERARAAGVDNMVVIADSLESAFSCSELAKRHGLAATAGVHPHEASSWDKDHPVQLRELLAGKEVVAVGEMGLDYHYDFSPREVQREVFALQLDLASELGMMAVVHAREADDDMVAMIRDTDAKLIMHSFSSGTTVLEASLDAGHYVSFSGMVTFKSWKDHGAVKEVPQDRLLVETDSPYLAPVPFRGKRNEPSHVVEVARKVGEIREVSFESICKSTTANARACFGERLV